MKIPFVALVGRPNVGKSTIFNRLVGKKIAIIDDLPGVTRDRLYGTVNYNNKNFHLVDTGGIDLAKEGFNDEVRIQAELAIDEADIVLFVVDGKEGLTSNDYAVRDMLIKANKKTIVVINKADNNAFKEHEYEFYELGFDHLFKVSAENNEGFGDLLDEVTKEFPSDVQEYTKDTIKFSIIGRPNVGKSSLVNALIGDQKVIVSEVPGTTRDAIDLPFTYHDQKCVVIDTAGLRKKGKVYESIERYSLLRTMKAIDRANVCVLVIDASEGIIEQDKHIAGYAIEAGKGIVVVVNKWDLILDKDQAIKKWTTDLRNNFQFMTYAPLVFLSAKTSKRLNTLMPEIIKAYHNAYKEIDEDTINQIMEDAYTLNLPPTYKARRLKIYHTKQVDTNPPTFKIYVNDKGLVHFSYYRYLENKIREAIDFEGTPIVMSFKNKGEERL